MGDVTDGCDVTTRTGFDWLPLGRLERVSAVEEEEEGREDVSEEGQEMRRKTKRMRDLSRREVNLGEEK